MPELLLAETCTPNPNQPFGAKGAGGAGCIGAPPALLNAVTDALGPGARGTVQLPATPEEVWRRLPAGALTARPAGPATGRRSDRRSGAPRPPRR